MQKWSLTGLRPEKVEVEIEGMLFQAREIKGIHAAFREWRIETGGRILPGDEDLVWEALKRAYPRYVIKQKKPGKPGLSVGAAWSFIRYLERRMRNKSLVDPVEAQRRADICATCPMKTPVVGCGVCVSALKLFIKPSVQLDPQPPRGCSACLCYLPLKVWIPREVLGDAGEFEFAEGCWMRE